MFELTGKVAIITGGAKGIGAGVVRRFLREGAKFVAFLDVDEASGISLEQDLQKEFGENALKFFKCDVTKDEELFEVFNYAVKHHGYVDVVLNNAAIGDDLHYKREIEVNFTAVVTSTLKALEIMRKDHGGPGGTIINISSIGAIFLDKDLTIFIYCGTKSAVLMFSASLGMEAYHTHTGVRVITMCFGRTATDITENVNGIDALSTSIIKKRLDAQKPQPIEVAAGGIVEAFKKGKSGSTWLVIDSNILDITERVTKGYQVMSGEIQI